MGLYSDYTAAYGEDSGATIPNIEWVLKTLDVDNSKSGGELDTKLAEIDSKITEGLATKAPINATLTDAAESNTLPATTSTPLTALLQAIRNNLKWLFNNKANSSEVDTKLGAKADNVEYNADRKAGLVPKATLIKSEQPTKKTLKDAKKR